MDPVNIIGEAKAPFQRDEECLQGRRGMNSESPMQSMHILPSRVFNTRGCPHLLWYAPSTMVLVLISGKYRAPRYFDVAHTEDCKVPYILVASLTEYHGKWTRATPSTTVNGRGPHRGVRLSTMCGVACASCNAWRSQHLTRPARV